MRRELLREVLAMQEEDRKRIARELHDETSQVLAGLTANLEAIAGMLPDGDGKAVRLVKKTEDLSVKILDEIHRLIYELRPSLLDDMGLVSAARWLAENNLEPAGVAVEFRTVGKARRLAPDLEVTLFRVIQEAMNNITRHAGARKARVVLNFRKASIVVQVSDDGRGFDVDEAINAKDRPRGLGLLGMRERVELVNGTIDIRSEPGGGTLIEVKIPIREEANNGKDKSAGG
jgi:signal transduction histidine kinase